MCIVFVLIVLPSVIATPSYYYKQKTNTDLKVSCFDENNTYCTASTTCNITIFYPNSTVLINNQNMTHNPSFYNYTLTAKHTEFMGEYSVVVFCDGQGTDDGYSTFTYAITKEGTENKPEYATATAIISFVLILVCFFLAFIIDLKVLKWFFAILGITFAASSTAGLLLILKGGSASGVLEAEYAVLMHIMRLAFAGILIWIIYRVGYRTFGVKKGEEWEEME